MTEHPYQRPALKRRAWFRFRALVRSERAWRLLGSLVLAGTAVYSSLLAVAAGEAADQARGSAARVVAIQRSLTEAGCATRIESRESIRDAIDVAVQVVAVYAKLTDAQQADLTMQVRAGVYRALPPPDC